MRTSLNLMWSRLGAVLGMALLVFLAPRAWADDIDIFLTPPQGTGKSNPAVLFVLDNTSNWSRQSQQWPGGLAQGQSEVQAISNALNALDATFSVGVMEFGTEAPATKNGGFVTFDVSPMDASNKTSLQARLATIKNNINDPHEKLSSGREYGELLRDVHQYIAGGNSVFGNDNVFPSHADSRGYVTNYTKYQSPLADDSNCGDVVIIFVSNPNASGPAGDSSTNTAALAALGGATDQIQYPGFTTTIKETSRTSLVNPTACLTDVTGTTSDKCLSSLSTSVASAKAACPGPNGTNTDSVYSFCACTALSSCTTGSGKNKLSGSTYKVEGVMATVEVKATGTFTAPSTGTGNTFPNADEWSRFFFQKGILLPNQSRRFVRTYTIDVFNAQQNADHTALMQSMARVGGGKYYEARNQAAIEKAIADIFSDIQSVNSTFTSASLPISATNRSQNDNQVYIGMFRPDPQSQPRWFGNLKQYRLIAAPDGTVQLGDAKGDAAVNPLTGFVGECARSVWTFDTGDYFLNTAINPSPQSLCVGNTKIFSDSPDGPRVEKGGVSEILRTGNNPPNSSSNPDYKLRRDVKTLSANSLVSFSTSTGLAQLTVDFTKGSDTQLEYFPQTPTTPLVEVRPSVHGDVVHSRPLPVNYGGATGTVVYYGANDGHLRAVSGNTGKELWSFVAPEHYNRLERLRINSPGVLVPGGLTSDDGIPRKKKDYFFDGSLGLFQNLNNSKVYVYPSMRRGGRMVYAFNVTTPTAPAFLWKAGCPNLTDDTGCTTGMTGIGQTWGTPVVGMVKGYSSGTKPVVFLVGGHDNCEDENTATPSCGSAKGRVVYALDGESGALLATFNPPSGVTMRSVVADASPVDYNLDGFVDHVYIADMGGNVFRIDLTTPLTDQALAPADWTMKRIAYTTGANRKFQSTPTLVQAKDTVYVAIGTGDREHPLASQYPYTDPIVNRFYVFVDKFDNYSLNLDSSTDMNNVTTGQPSTGCDALAILPKGTKRGWFFSLTDNGKGEQVVTSAAVVGGLVAFSTNRPTPEPVNACAANLGEARGYLVNVLTGSGAIGGSDDCGLARSAEFEGGGLPPSPVITRVNIDGTVRTVAIGVAQKDATVSSSIEAQRVRPKVNSIRRPTYWLSPQTTE